MQDLLTYLLTSIGKRILLICCRFLRQGPPTHSLLSRAYLCVNQAFFCLKEGKSPGLGSGKHCYANAARAAVALVRDDHPVRYLISVSCVKSDVKTTTIRYDRNLRIMNDRSFQSPCLVELLKTG